MADDVPVYFGEELLGELLTSVQSGVLTRSGAVGGLSAWGLKWAWVLLWCAHGRQ
jgi:hypothetical protein